MPMHRSRIEEVDLAADSDEYAVKVKWVGLDEIEVTWEPVSTIYAVVTRLRKLRLTKEVRGHLKKLYGMEL